MNMNSESSIEEKAALPFFTLQNFRRWCVDHYGFVASVFSLLGSFCAMLLIWLYLGEIEARDLFIPAFSDPKVGVFILFSAIIFLFALSILIGFGALSILMACKLWRERAKWGCIGKVFFVLCGLYMVSVFILAIYNIKLKMGLAESLVGALAYLAIVGLFVWAVCLVKVQHSRWWLPLVFCVLIFMSSLWAWSVPVANVVTRLAGIGQKPDKTRYYLVEKQFSPVFKVNKDLWKMAHEGDKLAVCGYKIFQLSDVTVLCPDAKDNKEKKYVFCVRMKSSELLAMPPNYVPEPTGAASGVPQNAASAHVAMPACGRNGA